MSYVSLLVHAQDDEDSDARVRLACSLARLFDSRLIGLAAASPSLLPAASVVYKPVQDTLADDVRFIESGLRAAESRFRRSDAIGKLQTEWHSRMELPIDAICKRAMTSDLVIVGRREEGQLHAPYSMLDPADAVVRSGRPVLIVPPGTTNLSGDRVVIAWKNTREARRAVIDAMPFLQAASEVKVLEIVQSAGLRAATERVNEVAEFLLLHNIEATGEAQAHHQEDTAEQIMLYAEHRHADLIVAGGHGHSQLREWIFGGVTRELLRRCPKCCLLSH